MLHVVVHGGKFNVLAECSRCASEELVGVSLGIVEDTKAQTFKFRLARGNWSNVLIHDAPWVEQKNRAHFVSHRGSLTYNLHMPSAHSSSEIVAVSVMDSSTGVLMWPHPGIKAEKRPAFPPMTKR